jgi:hypothetical protein
LLAESADTAGGTFLVGGYETSWLELREELDRQLGYQPRHSLRDSLLDFLEGDA